MTGDPAQRDPGKPAGPEAECPDSTVEIAFPSCPEYLALVRSAVKWFAGKCGFTERDCGRIVLSVVEATTNIIRHAYGGDEKQRISLRMTRIAGGVELEFLDDGCVVAPEDLERRAENGTLSPGGLGVRMMKTCMDDFRYEPRPGGGARLVLRKLRSGPEGKGRRSTDPK
ncbi:MAG TPA: ATP-binding protein [Planctomycetota bacterium]|nr:ATP-binding protein [Planctomycetota bacterium]